MPGWLILLEVLDRCSTARWLKIATAMHARTEADRQRELGKGVRVGEERHRQGEGLVLVGDKEEERH